MESHPLNLAHQQHRRAEAHFKSKRYDEAMQCHQYAAELLLEAMKSTTSSVALESITLQHSYHLKQKDFIKNKKELYARVKKSIDNIKVLSKEPIQNLQSNDCSKLQVSIYKIINESDSLLKLLSTQSDSEQGSIKDVQIKDDTMDKNKSQNTVVDELKTLSQNLYSLVEQLVLQAEVFKDENATLVDKVNYLEKERTKYLSLPIQKNDLNHYRINTSTIEDLSKEFVQKLPVTKTSDKQAVVPSNIERQTQKAHFDLSALKNN